MAQTTIISSIDRSNTYPESVLISAPSNCGTIMLTLGGTWTKQMVAELPTINIKMFTIDNEWCKDFNLDIDTSSIFTEDGIAQNATFQLYDIPQSFYLKITPVFDNNALAAHNNTQENGVVSSIKTVNGIVTNDETDIWTTITDTFDIELIFDDTSIVPGGGGGSATLIEKTITANGEYNASDDNADGYSSVSVTVANSYSQSDNGKVVSNQTLVSQTAYPTEIIENNTYDTTNYNSITVNVSGGGGNATLSLTVGEPGWFSYQGYSKEYLTSIEIPTDVVRIDDECFKDCIHLSSVIVPEGVLEISYSAFEHCALENVILPNTLEYIGSDAFRNNMELTSISIPSSVESFGGNPFYDCENLETLTFEGTTPPQIEEYGLGIPTTCIIRVPQGTLSDYTSASYYPNPNDYTYVEY